MATFRLRRKPSVWKGVLAGVAGGLAGTLVMTQFQNLWNKASEKLSDNGSSKRNEQQGGKEKKGEDATTKVAGKIAHKAGYKLSQAEKKKAGPVVHYGFGTAMGAAYGIAHEFAPRGMRGMHPLLAGTSYGTALFAGADEVALPALGLSPAPQETPASKHLYGLVSHVVYGLTAEMVRRRVRRVL